MSVFKWDAVNCKVTLFDNHRDATSLQKHCLVHSTPAIFLHPPSIVGRIHNVAVLWNGVTFRDKSSSSLLPLSHLCLFFVKNIMIS